MDYQEQVFFNVPLSRLEPIFKTWIKDVLITQKPHPQTSTPETLLTIQQASKFLNLSVPTIYSKVSKGELPVMKQGKRLYFSSVELMQFVKDGRKKTNAEIEAEADKYLKK